MINFDALIFDFDGVLLESEFEANVQLAELLTDLGHRHSAAEAIRHYTGLAGEDFIAAVEARIGTRLPPEFHSRIKEKSVRALKEGIDAVVGAVDFVHSLPPALPKAVASSSSTRWIRGHLDHLGLADAFGGHVYSGREHAVALELALQQHAVEIEDDRLKVAHQSSNSAVPTRTAVAPSMTASL